MVQRAARPYWLRIAGVSVGAAAVITALFVALGQTQSVPVTLRSALAHSVAISGLCGAVLPMLRRRVRGAGPAIEWPASLAGLLLLAAVGAVVACAGLTLLEGPRACAACVQGALPVDLLVATVLGLAFIVYESQRARLDELTLALRTRELEHERDRKLALQARLAALEARLQPHFMFNTLNAITALIDDDPRQAERTVERLAALLRFSLDATERGLVPLGHELKIVTDYLEIERTRFGERLAWTVDVPADAAACEVPPLAVQTLVENSVKHAVAPRPTGGRIRVEAEVARDTVVVRGADDGPGFTDADIRPGHGLDNVRGRLAARFGPGASLSISRDGGGAVVTLAVPIPR